MSEGPGFLEFFILEASDYVEQLDGLLLGASPTGPDADAMQRVARALRGTATMAKLPSFAEVAAGIERVGRAMQEGLLQWEPALSGAMVATIDDLKTLLHAARTWSPAEDRRASARTAELSRFAPLRPFTPTRDHANQRGAIAGSAFLATEAANIAAGLELLSTRAGAPDTASNLLRRVRALRGVAGVKAVGPLADVLEATEDATWRLEAGHRAMSAESRQLLETAAEYLRVISSALRFDGDFDAPSSARDAFVAAQAKWANQGEQRERVVPISTLFYSDGGPGVVEASQNPPTSTADRFRLELVSHGEHLRQIVNAVREGDASAGSRARRDLTRALQDLESAAESFGERAVADLVRTHLAAAEQPAVPDLRALDEFASLLSEPGAHGERLTARVHELSGQPAESASTIPDEMPAVVAASPAFESSASTTESEPAPVAHQRVEPAGVDAETVAKEEAAKTAVAEPAAAAPAVEPTPPRTPMTPAATLIDMSLAALDSLTSAPWITPEEIPEDSIVPIETLLYRGSAALDRAIEIRDELRRANPPADVDALEELFDLLELARAE